MIQVPGCDDTFTRERRPKVSKEDFFGKERWTPAENFSFLAIDEPEMGVQG